jgi:hypothetical protein
MPFRFFTENTMFFAPFLVAFISPFVFLQNRREVWAVLLFILVSLGVLASWPIVKDGGQRAIAVTTPFTCAIIACGVGMIVQIVNGQGDFFTNSLVPKVTKNRNEIYMVSFLTLVLFVGPLVLKVTKSRNIGSMIPLACPQKTLVFRVCKGSSIAIVDDDSSRDIRSVTIYDYLASGPARDGDTLFSTLRPGDYLYSGVYNFANPKQPCKYLVLKEDVARFAGKIVTCCVEKKGNNLWFGENVSLLSKKE